MQRSAAIYYAVMEQLLGKGWRPGRRTGWQKKPGKNYKPHQGPQEKARRVRNMARGMVAK